MRSVHSRISLTDILSRPVGLDFLILFISENTLSALIGKRQELGTRSKYERVQIRSIVITANK